MLKELRANHRNIIQMSFNGFSNNEIAEKLEMSPSTISSVLRSPLGKAYLDGLIDKAQETTLDVRKKLVSMNESALNAISRILDPKVKAPFNVQLTAAKDVLDRNGYKPSDKIDVNMMVHKSDEELEAEITAMEAAMTRNQLKHLEESPPAETPPKSDSCSEPLALFSSDDLQEVSPFLLDESASDVTQVVGSSSKSLSERPETSLAASISSPDLEVSASTIPANVEEPLPPEIQAKLDDESFDPFKNI